MKFLRRKRRPLKQAFARAVNSAWYRWRLFQFKRSRSILFWTLREIREHYRLWRMRPEIMKRPRSLMVRGHQVYHYGVGTHGVEMVHIDDAPVEGPSLRCPLDHWRNVEEHLHNKDIDETARKLGYEL